jgi:hypothetical protein
MCAMPEELTNAEQTQIASAVPQELPKAKKIHLAAAIVQGQSVAVSASDNGVPRSTGDSALITTALICLATRCGTTAEAGVHTNPTRQRGRFTCRTKLAASLGGASG